MFHLRRLLPAALAAALLVAPGTVRAQDFLPEEPPEAADAADDSTPEYLECLELQRKGRFASAQKAFRKFLKKYPNSVHKDNAILRSGPNHYAGVLQIHESGPPARRVDVTVMGDGFTVAAKDQKLEEKWAKLCLEVLWSEAAFNEYKDYFNYYYVRLVSEDEKVDPNITDAQKQKIDDKNKRRSKKRKYDYSTAIDCKEAGPQGQVMADRSLVFQWLNVAARELPGVADDGQVIAFARFGKLGMGGGGVANVGRPDKSITVHEFGHSFCRLLDEYTNNPNPPRWAVRAPNATSNLDDIPWQHFLDAKVKGVDVIEGGATFVKGVWRPARSCAMNSAGNSGYCPVCREAAVLRIYSICSPIDTLSPNPGTEMQIVAGDETTIAVLPMMPRKRELDVQWFVETIATDDAGPAASASAGATSDSFPLDGRGGWFRGAREFEDRTHLEDPPVGDLSTLGKKSKTKRGEPIRHEFHVGQLPPGRYKVTVQVRDTTKWVLKDEKKLLEDRETWWVNVSPKQ